VSSGRQMSAGGHRLHWSVRLPEAYDRAAEIECRPLPNGAAPFRQAATASRPPREHHRTLPLRSYVVFPKQAYSNCSWCLPCY